MKSNQILIVYQISLPFFQQNNFSMHGEIIAHLSQMQDVWLSKFAIHLLMMSIHTKNIPHLRLA